MLLTTDTAVFLATGLVAVFLVLLGALGAADLVALAIAGFATDLLTVTFFLVVLLGLGLAAFLTGALGLRSLTALVVAFTISLTASFIALLTFLSSFRFKVLVNSSILAVSLLLSSFFTVLSDVT